ncbi:MAG: dephospho-CoA kinase [Acidiferrobacterales bacterium]
MLRIGLTGGIGSGKSTAARLFAKRGAPVIDADEIAKEVVAPDQPAYQEIVQTFGKTILDSHSQLDRSLLRNQVFADSTVRRRLEAIIHPRVRREIEHRLQNLNAAYCVIVVPLLLEAKQQHLVDRILVIDSDEELQVRRVSHRSGLSEDEIRKIMAAQITRDERLGHADDVISNNADIEQLENQVQELHERYVSLADHAQCS